jgi:hypothetical protein
MCDLITKLDEVKDEHTFVAFLNALAQDRKNDPDDWQWEKIEDFLEAAGYWAESSRNGRLESYELPENTWKRVADILFSGKIYE